MSEAVAGNANAYDEVPYKSFPFLQTHPSRLATIGKIFGMKPALPNRCRVLELGCASGGNLLPMAERFPESEFIGVDLSQRAIAQGADLASSLGLRNLSLRHANIESIDSSWGEFDYVIAHGVFSWVPHSVQEKMFAICRQMLKPHGIGYISYNTYPGWRMRGMIRDVMLYRAQFFKDPGEQLREARALVDFLAKSVPVEKNPYGILLNDELKLLQSKEDYYLLHDFLEVVNTPLYFHEFIERAEQYDLQYLGESDFSVMSVNNFSPEVAKMVRTLSADVVQREQYMDFVRNRLFRQTLLCRRDVVLERNPGPETVYDLAVGSDAAPEATITDFQSRDRVTFTRPGSTMSTREPLMKAAMTHLREAWPRFVPFRELLSIARSRIYDGPVLMDSDRDDIEAKSLAEPLLRCFATTHVELSAFPLTTQLEISERPVASAVSRAQAKDSKMVSNGFHGTTQVSDLQRQLLRRLDGTCDREMLVESLIAQVQGGSIMIHENGVAIKDPDRLRPMLRKIVDDTLQQMAKTGLLIA